MDRGAWWATAGGIAGSDTTEHQVLGPRGFNSSLGSQTSLGLPLTLPQASSKGAVSLPRLSLRFGQGGMIVLTS